VTGESNRKNVVVLAGPTASGKTELSLALADKIPIEIVSADSRQVYRYMDIGTAKPEEKDLREVPHHCIDILDPDEYFSAGEYQGVARAVVQDIIKRGKTPVVAGGSGLYITALIDGVFNGDYKDTILRRKLKQRAETEGLDALYAELKKNDPVYAEKIHCNDLKRIIRALEVFSVSGKPISDLHDNCTEKSPFFPLMVLLEWERPVLYDRINRRVDAMIEHGLIEEVHKLLSMGYNKYLNSMDSVGYKEVVSYLEGEITVDEMTELIKRNTRRYAKKQITWFRRDKRFVHLDIKHCDSFHDIAQHILSLLGFQHEVQAKDHFS